MPYRSNEERIQDVLDAIIEIQMFTRGLDFDSFKADVKTIRAVELNFIIIGEAANQLSEDFLAKYPTVPWHLMRAMRNRLVHAYFTVDPVLVWNTIQDDLPALAVVLRGILGK